MFVSRRGRDTLSKLTPEEPQVFEMKDYMGPERGLCRDNEDNIKYFLEDARAIGVPRTRGRCAVDIQEYIRQQNMWVPFKNDKPGICLFHIILTC